MPTEYYFPDEDVYQKAVFWNELFSSSPGSESVTGGSSVSSSSNSSVISEDMNLMRYGGPLAKIPKTSHNLDFNGHKKLNRSQSEPRRYRHNNGTTSNKYKTELCHTFTESGGKNCKYGEKCQYAHGEEELRVVSRHPKYKTELCKTFHASEDAICPYGHRCHFIHRTPVPITNANTFYVMPNGMMSACSSLRDLTISPYGTSPTSSVFSFDGSMSPFMDNFSSSVNSPPPSPIEARLPVFDKLSRTASLPYGGLTA